MADADPRVRITARDARRLAITAQRLAGSRPKPTRAGILALVRDIGYLQLDPTNVVARNPVQVLWSRLGAYDPLLLEKMLEAHRDLFETPSLILPMSDLEIHAATMRAYRRATDPAGAEAKYGPGDNAGGGTWARYARDWLTKNRHVRGEVLARLRRDGPLPLTAFEDRSIVSWTSGGWNNERNITMILAILQRRGEIVVARRQRGQKVYGLADGWLPKTRLLAPTSLQRECARRALRSQGVATLRHMTRHYAFGRHITQAALDALERTREVVRVEVEGVASRAPYYALSDIEKRLRDAGGGWEGRTTLLSPFDNLIIDRDRTEQLFGYFYRMEIYVPAHLRTLGYWAMPVLHDDRIVGSVDPRFDRAEGKLLVNRVVLVPDAPRTAMPAIRRTVDELAEWLGAKRVTWPKAPVRTPATRADLGRTRRGARQLLARARARG